MKRLTTLMLTGVLFVAAPVAIAPAAPPVAQAEQQNNDDDFPWGLLGLLGLAGLAGLKKRDTHQTTGRSTGTHGV